MHDTCFPPNRPRQGWKRVAVKLVMHLNANLLRPLLPRFGPFPHRATPVKFSIIDSWQQLWLPPLYCAGLGRGLSGSQQLSRHSTRDSRAPQVIQPCELLESSVDSVWAAAPLNIRMPTAATCSTSCDSALSAIPDGAHVGFTHLPERAPPVIELLGIHLRFMLPSHGEPELILSLMAFLSSAVFDFIEESITNDKSHTCIFIFWPTNEKPYIEFQVIADQRS